MIQAKVTATADQLIDEGLYPQFCQPGQTIWIEKEDKDTISDYYFFKNKKYEDTIFTIKKEYVRIINK